MMIVTQQGMEILGVDLSPSRLRTNHCTSSCHVERMPNT